MQLEPENLPLEVGSLDPTRIITYSPAYTIVPTYECFNRCTYCNFRVDPGEDEWMSLDRAETILRSLQVQKAPERSPHLVQNPAQGVTEILILSGEVHPQSARRSQWLQRLYELGQLALAFGFLPHTNAGPLMREEMAELKRVNVSMGLMLEQITPTLMQTVHRHAPNKAPPVRLQQLTWAGELNIPFTTGLLLGIGESEGDRIATLRAIAEVHGQYRHIQEVILQPHSLGNRQRWQGLNFSIAQFIDLVAIARQILPAEITLQIPPNLLPDLGSLLACLEAGARDLGGIGPLDHVNPDYPHLQRETLAPVLAQAGWHLCPRLPVYPQYLSWLSPDLLRYVLQASPPNIVPPTTNSIHSVGSGTAETGMMPLEGWGNC